MSEEPIVAFLKRVEIWLMQRFRSMTRRHLQSQWSRSLVTLGLLPLLATIPVYAVFYAVRELPMVGDITDQAIDLRMNLYVDTYRPRAGAHPILFLDFDDPTSQRAGDPVLVPPALTASALAFLSTRHPWAVVVDLDLAYLPAGPELDALAHEIAKLAQQGTLVILARDTLPGSSEIDPPRLRPTALDPFVASAKGVVWAATASIPGSDGVVRSVAATQDTLRNGMIETLPSVPLVVRLLAMEGHADRVDRVISDGLGEKAVREEPRPTNLAFRTRSGLLLIQRGESLQGDYIFSWRRRGNSGFRINTPRGPEPYVRTVSMMPLLRSNIEYDNSLGQGGLVFVIATAQRRDMHVTPVGDMPGAYILANAANGWLTFGVQRNYFWDGLLILLLETVFLSLMIWFLSALVPRGLRRRVQGWFPPILTFAVWCCFLLLGNPILSVALIATSYAMTKIIVSCHSLADSLNEQPVVWGDPIC